MELCKTAVGRVAAVSTTIPKDVEIYGRNVRTSIVRDASAAPVRFLRGGPENNRTAVHTEEVLACFTDRYAEWQIRLNVKPDAWKNCHWGENIQIDGLTERDLRIGDRLRVGQTLLEVTSPRSPCFKLCWRLGQPESFLPALAASGATGCYLRVLQPGIVKAGDNIFWEQRAPKDSPALEELSALLFRPSIGDVDALRKAIATPGLGLQAMGILRERLTSLTDRQTAMQNRWVGWRTFVVRGRCRETPDVNSFLLEPEDGLPVAGCLPGQFVPVRLPTEAGHAIRTWSISDYTPSATSYRITVKRRDGGDASVFMDERVYSGTRLELRAPAGRFVLDRSGSSRVVFISAGVGVTPLVAMLKSHFERSDAPPVLWIHAARSSSGYPLKPEVDRLAQTAPNMRQVIFYSQSELREVDDAAEQRGGRLDAEAIKELIAATYSMDSYGRAIELPGYDSDFYICGPEAFEREVKRGLAEAGVEPSQVHSESFQPVSATSSHPLPETCEIWFARSKLLATWYREDGQSLLEHAETLGISAPFDCRIGICGSCKVKVLDGTLLSNPDNEQIAKGSHARLCCSKPYSSRVVLDV